MFFTMYLILSHMLILLNVIPWTLLMFWTFGENNIFNAYLSHLFTYCTTDIISYYMPFQYYKNVIILILKFRICNFITLVDYEFYLFKIFSVLSIILDYISLYVHFVYYFLLISLDTYSSKLHRANTYSHYN